MTGFPKGAFCVAVQSAATLLFLASATPAPVWLGALETPVGCALAASVTLIFRAAIAQGKGEQS